MRLYNILIIAFLIYSQKYTAPIVKVKNIMEVMEILKKKVNKNTLVIFDVNNVIITPTEDFTLDRPPIRVKLLRDLMKKCSQEQLKEIFADFAAKRKIRLVNEGILSLFEYLREHNIPTTVLTRWDGWAFGEIDLYKLNISFGDISPFKNDLTLQEVATHQWIPVAGIPMVQNGMILTSFADKGKVLCAVLAREKVRFDQIIFIDDKVKNLKSVQKACKKIQVPFLGIHYIEAELISTSTVDDSIEKLRFAILNNEKKWLSNEELRTKLLHQN